MNSVVTLKLITFVSLHMFPTMLLGWISGLSSAMVMQFRNIKSRTTWSKILWLMTLWHHILNLKRHIQKKKNLITYMLYINHKDHSYHSFDPDKEYSHTFFTFNWKNVKIALLIVSCKIHMLIVNFHTCSSLRPHSRLSGACLFLWAWGVFIFLFTHYVEQTDTATTLRVLGTTEAHMAPATFSASDINSAKSTHIEQSN